MVEIYLKLYCEIKMLRKMKNEKRKKNNREIEKHEQIGFFQPQFQARFDNEAKIWILIMF